MMESLNNLEKQKSVLGKPEAIKIIQLLAPFAPYLTEQLWLALGQKGSVHASSWPKVEKKYLLEDEVDVVVQVNGKVRATIRLDKDQAKDENQVTDQARKDINAAKHLSGREILKTIFIPQKLINFVVK